MEKINRKPNNQKMENRILDKLDEIVDNINALNAWMIKVNDWIRKGKEQ